MDHGASGDRFAEPGAGDDQHRRGRPDQHSRGEGARAVEDSGVTELEGGGELPAIPDDDDVAGASSGQVAERDPDSENGRDDHQDPVVLDFSAEPAVVPALPGLEVFQYQGPLPPAAQLAEYDRIVPGLARQLADAALADMESDRRVTEIEVNTARSIDLRGQAFAIVLTSVCVFLAALCLFLLEPAWLAFSGAGIFGLGAVSPVINAFLRRNPPAG